MTLDQLFDRDQRIAELDRLGDARSVSETEEFYRLVFNRKQFDRRLTDAVGTARRRVRELETYAAQHGLPLEQAA